MEAESDGVDMEAEVQFEIPRTERFETVAKELSEFINGLNLTADAHNILVGLIIEQVRVAEEDACTFGIDLGIKIAQ